MMGSGSLKTSKATSHGLWRRMFGSAPAIALLCQRARFQLFARGDLFGGGSVSCQGRSCTTVNLQ